MTRQQVTRTHQRSKSEPPLVNGILQRAAIRVVPENEVQPTDQVETPNLKESRFHHDFTQVPIHTGTFGKENKTGMPDRLKTGIENLSGYSMDDVRVHYNSDKLAQLQAHTYAPVTKSHTASSEQGTEPNLQAKGDTEGRQGHRASADLSVRISNLGHSYGNLMVQAPTRSVIQPKLTIGQPGDKYEQEADSVAADVVQRINQPQAMSSKQGETVQRQEVPENEELQMKPLANSIQRQEVPFEEELQMKPLLQRREAIGGGQASTDLKSSINIARGGGQPLDTGLQRSMGQAMGADFSSVKVHTDAKSDQLNQSIQAKAFTTGQDVFFRQGAYEPGSRGGQELIAHELTHVVQQNGGAVQRSQDTLQRKSNKMPKPTELLAPKAASPGYMEIWKLVCEYVGMEDAGKDQYHKEVEILSKIQKNIEEELKTNPQNNKKDLIQLKKKVNLEIKDVVKTSEGLAVKEAFSQRGENLAEENPKFSKIKKLSNKKNYKEILKSYDYNWFVAKEHLAYVTYAKNPAEYGERMVIMKDLLKYRKQETEEVLKPVMLNVATDVRRGKAVVEGSFKPKGGDTGYTVTVDNQDIIDANAPGSQSLTSDIDISFGVPGNEEFEVDLVQQFNHAFRKRWGGVEAGVVFDVNAYSSGFMAKAAGHLQNSGYEQQLGEKKQEEVVQSQKHTQLALGFLPIRKYFDGKPQEEALWARFKLDTLIELRAHLKGKYTDEVLISSALDDVKLIFEITEHLHAETKKEMSEIKKDIEDTREENSKRKNGANQPKLSEKHLEAVTGDMLYEAQLHKIRDLLEKRKQIIKSIELLQIKEPGNELEDCRDQLAKNLIETEREQGKALVYANEAYYTAGAAIHVVKGMQSGGAVQLSSQQQMASLLMNIGYKLMHYEHNEHEGGQGRALVATSKYGERIRDIVKQGTPEHMKERKEETKKEGAGGLYNKDFDPKLHELLKNELSVLDREKELIVKYKKTKSLESPSAREAKAQTDLGEEMNTETQNKVYLTIAMKALAPYYEHEFSAR